jgi:hypothetical protein
LTDGFEHLIGSVVETVSPVFSLTCSEASGALPG